jgi:acetolactate synthase I/II/III large subunit
MRPDYTASDLGADCPFACGVEVGFWIVSVHNIPILDALSWRGQIRFVMTRGELGAPHMADGYSRVVGTLGLVITSTGPGASNAMTGLLEAQWR